MEQRKRFLEENLDFLIVAIRDLMEKDFPCCEFDIDKDIKGRWKIIGSPTNFGVLEHSKIRLVKND